MKKDLAGDPDVRDVVVLPNERVGFNWSQKHFRYYQSDDPELRAKCERLHEAGYLQPKPSNVPVCRMTQEFVDLVLSE